MSDLESALESTHEDASTLLALPLPEFSGIDTASPSRIFELCEHFYELWELMLSGKPLELPKQATIRHPVEDGELTLVGDEVWDYVFLLIASYYHEAFSRYMATDQRHKLGVPRGANSAGRRVFIPVEGFEPKIAVLRLMSYHYFGTIYELVSIELFRLLPGPAPILAAYEAVFHGHLPTWFEIVVRIDARWIELAATHLFEGVLTLAKDAYEREERPNLGHFPGPFSSIRLPDLAFLAGRHPSMISKYGETHVARVFESQLALIAQSFGLYVVLTKVGTSTIDLVCISSRPGERLSFLIEAKSSKRAYYLPKRDSRALRDYVSAVQASLATLPPLSFVLVIGHQPALTLEKRLAALQANLNLPVRFMKAQDLADLRDRLPGPLPMRSFVDQVLTSPSVLPREAIESIIASSQLEQRAHKEFVETMLSAAGYSK